MPDTTWSAGAPVAARPRGYRFEGWLVVLVVSVLLFVPKVNVVPLPGFTIQAKPEDVLWLALTPLFVVGRFRMAGAVGATWLLLMAYLTLSISWAPSNSLLVIRLLFYSFPLLYALDLDERHEVLLFGLARAFLWSFAIVAFLQTAMAFPYLHTGELLMGPVDRASGIYGNGVEFALLAFMAFWLLVVLGDRSMVTWLAALAIAYCSGTRVVLAMLLASGLVYVQMSKRRVLTVLALGAFSTLAVAWLAGTDLIQGRLLQVDVRSIVAAFRDVAASAQGSREELSEIDGYCFDFDESLFEDQSLAMRLSKLLFVTEHVILGAHPLGLGLGRCLGDAGDNLYVRVLSDAGLPYLTVVALFLAAMLVLHVDDVVARRHWRLFVISFALVSLFYDTLYFSRVAPLLFVMLAVLLRRERRSHGTSEYGP